MTNKSDHAQNKWEVLKDQPKIDQAARKIINRIPDSIIVQLVNNMTNENPEEWQPSCTDGLMGATTLVELANEYFFQVLYDVLATVYGIED